MEDRKWLAEQAVDAILEEYKVGTTSRFCDDAPRV
jgi:hypothetical protein